MSTLSLSAPLAFNWPSFVNPSWFWILAGIFPAIIILYFLKLKRNEHVVSSTLLWLRAIDDLRVNAPWQRLRQNLLLFLQLLLAFLLVLALTRPTMLMPRRDGERTIVLIDRSASMTTADADGRTRLEAARDWLLKKIDSLGKDDSLLLVAYDTEADVLTDWTGDKAELSQVVRGLQQRHLRTDIRPALRIAGRIVYLDRATKRRDFEGTAPPPPAGAPAASGAPPAASGAPAATKTPGKMSANEVRSVMESDIQVLVVSDGAFAESRAQLEEELLLGALRGTQVSLKGFGQPSDNTGIVTLEARRGLSEETRLQLYYSVANYRGEDPLDKATRLQSAPAYLGLTARERLPEEDPATGAAPASFDAKQYTEAALGRLAGGDLLQRDRDLHRLFWAEFSPAAEERAQAELYALDDAVDLTKQRRARAALRQGLVQAHLVVLAEMRGRSQAVPHPEPLVKAVVSLYLGESRAPADVQQLEVHAGKRQGGIFRQLGMEDREELGQTLSAQPKLVRLELEPKDAFPLDNTAWIWLEPVRKTTVLWVHDQPDLHLQKILALTPDLEAVSTDLAGYNRQANQWLIGESTDLPDVVIFEGVAPVQERLVDGAYVFINALPPLPGFRAVEEASRLRDLAIMPSESHPIVKWINLTDNVAIFSLTRAEFPKGWKTLIGSSEGDLIGIYQTGGISTVVLTFDPMQSTWWLLRSYPLFIARTIHFLAQTRLDRATNVHHTGDELAVRAGQAKEIRFSGPPGVPERSALPGKDGYARYAETLRCGVYQGKFVGGPEDGRVTMLPVNLLSPEESDNSPGEKLDLGEGVVAEQVKRETSAEGELWKWAALAAFGLLLLEWYIYNRRAWV